MVERGNNRSTRFSPYTAKERIHVGGAEIINTKYLGRDVTKSMMSPGPITLYI